jgi:hypothetical protein
MTQPNDGGPAFPRAGSDYNKAQEGMSLRDWFAGQALAGIGASDLEHSYIWQRFSDDVPSPNGISELCYMIADAMLKAREASNDSGA